MTEPTQTTAPKLVKLSSLKADRNKEREGDWIAATDIGLGVEFFVRSTNYAPYRIARNARLGKLSRKYGGNADDIPDEVRAVALGELAIEFLLIDWKGFADDDHKPIPFSDEVAGQVLTDEAYRDLRGSVYLAAMKVGQAEVEFVEQTAKN